MARGDLITRLSGKEAELKAKYNGNNNLLVGGMSPGFKPLLGIIGKSPLLSFFWKMKFQNHAFVLQSCVAAARGQCGSRVNKAEGGR